MRHARGTARWAAFLLIAGWSVAIGAPAVGTDLAADRLEASYNASADFLRYPALDEFLATISRKLQAASPEAGALPLRLHAMVSDLPYAFVLDNGAAYVSTGLIARLDDEAELAALLALPQAATIRQDRATLSESARRHALHNLIPNLLLLTVTAGLGAPAVGKSDRRQRNDDALRTQAASDAVALQWLRAAGYDPAAAARAARHLHDRLLAEDRNGGGDYSDPALLAARAESLDALATSAARETVEPAAPASVQAGPFAKFSRFYAIRQATIDIDEHPSAVLPVLDRLDGPSGERGDTANLRAQLIRRSSATDAQLPAAIAAFERAIAYPDVPATAFRELGLLYRRAGDASRWKQAFATYIARAPNAGDVAIYRSYLEEP